ncbi:tyrosine-type recombinase/integrase [Krasilnikoviella flava]|uniref:Site-specific recombinase XerD n=1 Tax=Krasilnikoviella flava TaxID=526729 RepID=A0A1T5LL27_9MICO|nr:histone-like nucleoid-structuring protein Lsr2 [Krasilnikoviella flava]SKC76198.1 Site-specific recombinase XerD [Krasilnikoviella flava]
MSSAPLSPTPEHPVELDAGAHPVPLAAPGELPAGRPVRRAARRQTRRGYGNVNQLPSGRWRARYTGPDGKRRTIGTYPTRGEADAALAGVLSDVYRGTYRAPERGAVTLATYARRWLAQQTELRPRTVDLYARLLDRWVLAELPVVGSSSRIDLGRVELRALTPTGVAEWFAAVSGAARASATARAERAAGATDAQHARAWARAQGMSVGASGRLPAAVVAGWRTAGRPAAATGAAPSPDAGRTQAAQAYRLLRTVCNAAVRERLIDASPCQVRRAGQVKPAERVPATPEEVDTIAAAMPERYRAAVVAAAWSALRAGELFALERRHVERVPGGGVRLRVEQALVDVAGQPVTFGPPKSDAGRRTVNVHGPAAAALLDHLRTFTGPGAHALVFATESGRPVRASQRTQMFARARRAAGRDDLRWHDLRHTGATRAAEAGATLRELQNRLGHSTIAAALVYQHASDDADRRLAERMAAMTTRETDASNVYRLPA